MSASKSHSKRGKASPLSSSSAHLHSLSTSEDLSLHGYAKQYSKQRYQLNHSKVFSTPTIYISATIIAVLLYQLDSRYDLPSVSKGFYEKVLHYYGELTQLCQSFQITQGQIFIMAFALLGIILIVKKGVEYRRSKQRSKKQNNENEEESDEDNDFVKDQKKKKSEVVYCNRIVHEEYEYQASLNTKREISKLTNSNQYKDALQQKGSELEGWNWQAYQRSQGHLQPSESEKKEDGGYKGEEEEKEDDFDLSKELEKVEGELKVEKIQNAQKRRREAEGSQQRQQQSVSPFKKTPISNINKQTPSTQFTNQRSNGGFGITTVKKKAGASQ